MTTTKTQAPRIFVYIVGVCAVAIATIAAIVILTVFQTPPVDNTAVIAVIAGIAGPIITALLGGAVYDLHGMLNSRLTELVEVTRLSAFSEGQAQGNLEGRAAAEHDYTRGPMGPKGSR